MTLPGIGLFQGHLGARAKVETYEPGFVNVGGAGDCGVRSFAAAIIDSYRTKRRTDDVLWATILTKHLDLHPRHARQFTVQTPLETILQKISLAELIDSMGHTLRQMGVDEIEASRDKYRGPFVENHEQTSPLYMRQKSNFIDETLIVAIANKLQVPVTVEEGKGLFRELNYGQQYESDKNPKLIVKLENRHYMPYVIDTKSFLNVRNEYVHAIEPVTAKKSATQEQDELKKLLQEKKLVDEEILKTFEETLSKIEIGVADGILDKDSLFDIYNESLSKESSDYLQGFARGGYGSEAFIEALRTSQNPAPTTTPQPMDDKIISSLAHAIARAVSIGHLDADKDVWSKGRRLGPGPT